MAADEKLEFTRDWYAARIERLSDLCKQHGCWDDASKILANGTTGPNDPPTYARTLTVLRARAEAAEQRAEALAAEVAQARAEGEAAGFRRGVAACVADVEGCLDFAAKAAKGPHNSERLRIHRNVRAVVLGQVVYGLRHIGGMGPRPEVAQG